MLIDTFVSVEDVVCEGTCAIISGHEGWVQALTFSTDGYLLVSCADDEMVKIWSVYNGLCLKTLESQTETSSHCGFHPSGALVASGTLLGYLDCVIVDSTAMRSSV